MSTTLDEREVRLTAIAMQCLKSGPPDVDLEKFALMAGYASTASAGNAWRPIKAKIFSTTAEGGAPPATPKKKRAPKSKKGAEDGAGEGDDEETPKKTPKRKAAAKDNDEEDGGSPKKRGRKPAVKKENPREESEENAGDANADAAGVKEEDVDDGTEDHV